MIRKTIPRLQGLDAPSTTSGDASPSLQRHNHNLGTRKGGVTSGVGWHSTKSLHCASLDADMRAVSFPDLDRVAPALQKGSLSEQSPPQPFAGEEGTNKLTDVPPPPPLQLDLDQLRAVIMAMEIAVKELAEHSFGEQDGEHNNNTNNNNNNTNNNNNNNNNNEYNTNDDNNNNHTHNNTNNNNYNPTCQESSLSLDLDNANPESKPDLDSPSLVSLNSETGFESLNQHGADLCLGTLGETTRTIGFSLENLDQAMTKEESSNSLDQEGKLIGTSWEPSLDWNPSLDTRRDKNNTRNKTKKKVSFAQASLAYKKEMQEQRRQQNSQLETA